MIYLYVTETGSFWQSSGDPTEDEIRMVGDGILTIFKYNQKGFYKACVGLNDDQILDIIDWEGVSDD